MEDIEQVQENEEELSRPSTSNAVSLAGDGSEDEERPSRFLHRDSVAVDRSYFKSYGAFGIHREMLSDKVRFKRNATILMAKRATDFWHRARHMQIL